MTAAPYVTATSLQAAGFAHGFSTRPLDLGLDTETPDHAALAAAVGYDRASLRTCKQVHGAAVLDGLSVAASRTAEADALIARVSGTTVGVRVADCVPILLADPRSGAVAAVHAGWRGVVAGVLPAAVRTLGVGRDVLAAVGPCIALCCFEVGDDVAAQIAAATAPDVVRSIPGARPRVDLVRAVAWQLGAAGIQRIERVGGCTSCDAARWHSYRRDGARSGRMLAAISAREPG